MFYNYLLFQNNKVTKRFVNYYTTHQVIIGLIVKQTITKDLYRI